MIWYCGFSLKWFTEGAGGGQVDVGVEKTGEQDGEHVGDIFGDRRLRVCHTILYTCMFKIFLVNFSEMEARRSRDF